MDMRKVFPSSLRHSKSKRDPPLSAAAAAALPSPQNFATPQAHKPTMPITIPRRKVVRPPPCSPMRQQPSPDIVFNLDFSFSPCSFQGHGQILTRKDEWAPQTQFLQQRGRNNLALAHQCYQQQKALCGLTRRNSSTRRGADALHRGQPLRPGLLTQALRTQERAYSQGLGSYLEDEPSEDLTNHGHGIVESEALASAYVSPTSSDCSSIDFAIPPHDNSSLGRRRCFEDQDEFADPDLTSAFQRSTSTASAQNTSSDPSPFESPSSHAVPMSTLPSPPATSRTPSTPSSPSSRRALRSVFSHNRSSTHLLRTTAAEPVVCLKVAQAERPDAPRRRSAYPETDRMLRARRTSSVGSRPTVMTLGRTQSSLVLSNEELERSLEKEDHRAERGHGPERDGREDLDEKEMVKGWEMEYERGRTRGRTRGRGIAVVRAPPAHM